MHVWIWYSTCATWLGGTYHLLLPVVTRALTEHKSREESVRKNGRATPHGQQMQNHTYISHASVVTYIWPNAAENHLCYLKQQIDNPEVLLIWCYSVMNERYLTFVEHCITLNCRCQLGICPTPAIHTMYFISNCVHMFVQWMCKGYEHCPDTSGEHCCSEISFGKRMWWRIKAVILAFLSQPF